MSRPPGYTTLPRHTNPTHRSVVMRRAAEKVSAGEAQIPARGSLQEIFELFSQGRILRAYEDYKQFSAETGARPQQQQQSSEEDKLSEQETSTVKLLMERYLDVMKCLSSNEGLDWTLGREVGGLKAFYQVQQDGSISACVHGLLLLFSFPPPLSYPALGTQEDVPVFEQAVVLSDIERLCAWLPLFSQSDLITSPGPSDLRLHHPSLPHNLTTGKFEAVVQVTLSTPFLSRDSVLHAWTADCLSEHQTYICFGKYDSPHPHPHSLPVAGSYPP